MFHSHTVTAGCFGPDPCDEIVNFCIAAPGMPIHRLPFCFGQHRLPVCRTCVAADHRQQGRRYRNLAKFASVHIQSPRAAGLMQRCAQGYEALRAGGNQKICDLTPK